MKHTLFIDRSWNAYMSVFLVSMPLALVFGAIGISEGASALTKSLVPLPVVLVPLGVLRSWETSEKPRMLANAVL